MNILVNTDKNASNLSQRAFLVISGVLGATHLVGVCTQAGYPHIAG